MIKPVGLPLKNKIQHRFKELCDLGGGPSGSPARGRVQALLKEGGVALNKLAFSETRNHLDEFASHNPWHVCFAVGLAWGHLAQLELDMTEAAVSFLASGDGKWLDRAADFHLERGADAIRKPLAYAYQVFQSLRLPEKIPNNLEVIRKCEERWWGKVLGPPRVPYIGSWNSTALFMVAVFSQPHLAAMMKNATVILPPGGPVYNALKILHSVKVLQQPPDGNDMDDDGWQPGVLFSNNVLMESLIPGNIDLNMIDLHSGLYLLGTNHPYADQWLER